VGLLVFGRAWRFLRIIYNLFLVVHEVDESILHKHIEQQKEIDAKIKKLEVKLKQWKVDKDQIAAINGSDACHEAEAQNGASHYKVHISPASDEKV